jgi:hypothetical protein
MREIYKGGVTPQQKMVGVNQKFGNVGIPSQQGTTRILYDTIQNTAGKTNFRFFEDSTARQFPLTNTGSEGNKLGVGDTMVIQQIQFLIWEDDFASEPSVLIGFNNTTNLAYVNFEIANNQVIKKLTLSESDTHFNKDTQGTAPISLETNIVIPPLLTFVLELQLPVALSVLTVKYVECQIIGAGGIIAPRTTF